MKTILTLKTSSMFFLGSVNLYKGIPVEVNTDDLTPSTVRIVNQAITSGRIGSSEGLLEVAEKETKAEEVAVESPVEVKVEETVSELEVETKTEEKEDEAPVVEAEVKAPVKKKPTPAKKKAE